MRLLKAFAIIFFLCSLVLVVTNGIVTSGESDDLWITAENDEVTVSVKDEPAAWQVGISAGVGDESLTDRIQLTHVGKMNQEGVVNVTYTVIDDMGRVASLIRKVRFSDYTPPTFELLLTPTIALNSEFVLRNMIMVTDVLDGNITHLVRAVYNDLDVTVAGTYDILLTVENSYGVRVDYTLTIEVI